MIVKAQKVRQDPKPETVEDLLARFCYRFPQYKYHEAKKMPFVRVLQMLKVAEKERARDLHAQTIIAAAPHTPKMKAVKSLLSKYEEIINK